MIDLIRIIVFISIYLGLFTFVYYLLTFLDRKKVENKITKYPFVSIIIPAYNEQNCLRKTAESAYALNYPKDKYEIIIVDDGSKDKTYEIAKKLQKELPIVRAFTKKNGGKGSALNYGIKRAHGEIIVSFDADSMVTPDSLVYMLPYFYDKDVVCVTPAMKVYHPKGILQRVQAIEYDLGVFLRKVFSQVNAVHVTPGPFSAYRKSFFDKHGGYDEDNITEDMEIALRIQSLNYKIENSPRSVVYTLAPKNFLPLLKQRRRWYFGFIRNFIDYKFIIGKKYGELGLFILPLAIISILSTMIIKRYYIIKSIIDTINQVQLYSYIGFDFINNLEFKSYLLTLNLYRVFSEGILIFGIFFFVTTLIMLLIVNKKIVSIDKPISTFISYIFFIFLYSLLFTFWWGVSIIYSISHRRINW